MSSLVDSHCHLGHIERPVEEVIDEATAAGIGRVIDIGMGLVGSEEAVRRANESDRVFASVGIHPNDLTDFDTDRTGAIAALQELASRPRVVAIGETGLDYYRDRSSPEAQIAAFRAHIDLAKQMDRTLVIHCRDAHDDVLRVLEESGPPARVVMHCFSGDVAFARVCGDRGYYCSFAGNLTYKRSETLREAARVVPEQLLLLETDAPFLAPDPYRGRPNAPALLVHTARVLANVLSKDFDDVCAMTTTNIARAFVM